MSISDEEAHHHGTGNWQINMIIVVHYLIGTAMLRWGRIQ